MDDIRLERNERLKNVTFMQKKYTYLTFIFVVVMLLLPVAQTALALELTYPTLPFGNITPNSNIPSLPQFIAYVFYFFISVSGIIGVIAIVIGGFEFLISAGNETLISEAKDRIRSAVFGIILLMCTFILIKAVNPDLLNLRANPQTGTFNFPNGVYVVLPGGGAQPPNTWGVTQRDYNIIGIRYAKAHDEDEIEEESDYIDDYDYLDSETGTKYYTSNALDSDTLEDKIPDVEGKYLYFKCSPQQEEDGVVVTAQIYYKDDFEEDSSTKTVEIECGGVEPLDGVLSDTWKIRDSGIYLYSKAGCEGDSSYDGITTSQDIPDDFSDSRSLKIINDPENEIYWGLVMNAASGFRGECSQPAVNITKEPICVEISLTKFTPRFISVFNWDRKYGNRKYQDGLTLYGMPVEIEAPPADTGDPEDPGDPDDPGDPGEEGDPEGPENEQDYHYIGADKVQNHWYYVQEGYAEHKAGYFTQAYYNISGIKIKNDIDANGLGYYTCFNDPAVLLKEHDEGVEDPCDSGDVENNVCVVADPSPPASQKNCLIPNSPYCIQSMISRGNNLVMLYAQNENGDNRTCSMFSDDVIDLQKIDFRENGKDPYRLNIIPVR